MGMMVGVMLEPFDWSSSLISLTGMIFLLAGVIVCIVAGLIVDRTKKYSMVLRTLNLNFFLLFCTSTFLFYLFRDHYTGLIVVVKTLGSGNLVATIPISIALGAEMTFPLSP